MQECIYLQMHKNVAMFRSICTALILSCKWKRFIGKQIWYLQNLYSGFLVFFFLNELYFSRFQEKHIDIITYLWSLHQEYLLIGTEPSNS